MRYFAIRYVTYEEGRRELIIRANSVVILRCDTIAIDGDRQIIFPDCESVELLEIRDSLKEISMA